MLQIKQATESDLDNILQIHQQAFGSDQGAEIVNLVAQLLIDPTAKPLLSLLAINNNQAIGHILFTKVHINSHQDTTSAVILAPLAVIPNFQSQGVGGQLIKKGLQILAESGVELVFVLGYPQYYTRYGFIPAGIQGLTASYPIAEKNADAWMVQELRTGLLGKIKGKVLCADALDKPEYWIE